MEGGVGAGVELSWGLRGALTNRSEEPWMVKEWDCRWGTRASTRGTPSLMTCGAEHRACSASVLGRKPHSPACHLGRHSFLSSHPQCS